ncbi:MAG: 4Fe-4S binding protein [Halobacteriota archaeon]|nr:4Fe-4S binding protein [Halobacteriota archaeon]
MESYKEERLLMDFTRREVMKIAAYTGFVATVPIGLQGSIGSKMEATEVPGTGNMSEENISKVDVDAFLSGCARCGVCATVCPKDAIRYSTVFLPILTPETRDRCPSTLECSVCMRYCPTNAVKSAFEPLGYENTALYKREQRLEELE